MLTNELRIAAATVARGSARNGPVVVAVAGPDAATTMRVGAAIADRLACATTFLRVVDVPLMSLPDTETARAELLRFDAHAAAARDEMRSVLPPDAAEGPSRMAIVAGEVPRTIARVARELEASLVVMGIGPHRPVDRVTGAETVLRTLRTLDCPVLAVSRSLDALPKSAAVGVDFSGASRSAASAVARLLPPDGILHLVHVWQPLAANDRSRQQEDDRYRQELPQRLRRFVADLALPERLHVTCAVREGPPTERLTDFASAHRIDVIAIGRHGRTPSQRLLVGGVAGRVLRSADCTVLIAPEPVLPDITLSGLPAEACERSLPRSAWTSELDAFARRNAGHVVTLASDDPEHGVTSREHGYLLFGTTFDPTTGEVGIVLGENNGRRAHLTRRIRGAEGLSLVGDAAGADVALRIVHGRGESVLSMAPRSSCLHPA